MTKKTTYLKDYTPPAYLIPQTSLRIALDPASTRVEAKLLFERNPAHTGNNPPLVLDGEQLQRASHRAGRHMGEGGGESGRHGLGRVTLYKQPRGGG